MRSAWKWLTAVLLVCMFVFVAPASAQAGKKAFAQGGPHKAQWPTLLFQFDQGGSAFQFAKEQMCFFEDMAWQGSTSGTIQPGETKHVTLYTERWRTTPDPSIPADDPLNALGRHPYSGIPYGCFDWGPGNVALRVSAGVSKGAKLSDIELHVIGNVDYDWLTINKIPKDSIGVPYNNQLVSTIHPHVSWTPCPAGTQQIWQIWGAWQNIRGGMRWDVDIVSKSSKPVEVGTTLEAVSMDCTGELFSPPEFRGDTEYIEGLLKAQGQTPIQN